MGAGKGMCGRCEEKVLYVKCQHLVYRSPAFIDQNKENSNNETQGMQAHILHPTTLLVSLACLRQPLVISPSM